MTENEIKKYLYKNDVKAYFYSVKDGNMYYRATWYPEAINAWAENPKPINFTVPIHDIGSTSFYTEMSAKHLIRWLNKNEYES